MRSNVAVEIDAYGMNLPARKLLFGHTYDITVFNIVKRRDIDGNIVAHAAIFGIVGVAFVGLNRENSFALTSRPSADTLTTIERRICIEIGGSGNRVRAWRGRHADRVPEARKGRRRTSNARNAESRLCNWLLHAFEVV